MSKNRLVPPCSYQGGKQRLAEQIVNEIRDRHTITDKTYVYDLCCGSGAVSMEFISQGVKIENLFMLDKSSWGVFWEKIGDGSFDLELFKSYCDKVPDNLDLVQEYLKGLSKTSTEAEAYKFLLMQAGAFGSKQIYIKDGVWKNTSFRDYWKPTETSVRRSPVTPMKPHTNELYYRVDVLSKSLVGLKGVCVDIFTLLEDMSWISSHTEADKHIIYIDPPYLGTTGYAFSFDWLKFVEELKNRLKEIGLGNVYIYVSEAKNYSEDAMKLTFNSNKGGITGKRKVKLDEWLNVF